MRLRRLSSNARASRGGAFLMGFVLCVLIGVMMMRKSSTNSVVAKEAVLHPTPKGQRVLCWSPYRYYVRKSTSSSSQEQIDRVLRTHAPLCDKFYFVTQHGNESTTVLPWANTQSDLFIAHHYERLSTTDLWNQVSRSWYITSKLFLEDYDWFIKVDLDSFLIPGNLRLALKEFDADKEERYFGHTLLEQSHPVEDWQQGLFNAGAGYGVSRALLRAIQPYLVRDNEYAPSPVPLEERCLAKDRWGEDPKFAECLRVVRPNMVPDVMKDRHGRDLFFIFEPLSHMIELVPGTTEWFWHGKDMNRTKWGLANLPSRPVVFHHMKHNRDFFGTDYLVHRVGVDPILY